VVIALLASVLFTAAPESLPALESEQQRLFDRMAPSVVLIVTKDGAGSGFFVSNDGLILTNAHVVGTHNEVDVALHDGRHAKGTVVDRAAKSIDLALVQVPFSDTPAPALGSIADVRVGSWVGAIGHGEGMLWSFNTGMVSNIYREGAERPVFQTQIPLNPGNSGGPIFDLRGRVIGIVTSGIKSANAINFGIGMEVARKSLDRLASACDCVVIDAPDGVPVFVDGVMAGLGPRVVHPVREHKDLEVFAVVNGAMKKEKVRFPTTRAVSLK
jgi:S1-C subfamily serine protease